MQPLREAVDHTHVSPYARPLAVDPDWREVARIAGMLMAAAGHTTVGYAIRTAREIVAAAKVRT